MVEVIKKGTNFLAFPVYVLAQLEDALDDCAANRSTDALKALDEAVAVYSGSMIGADAGASASGVLVFSHAQQRCVDFKTCGSTGTEVKGNAKVNIEVFANFTQMKTSLIGRNCTAARANKEAIAKKMFIPFIQGTMRNAYLQSAVGAAQSAKVEAEGAIYAAAILPLVAKCNITAASVIYSEMKPNSNNTANFAAIKVALESNYKCMGILCGDVGGFFDGSNSKFFIGAEPCNETKASAPPPSAAPTPRRGLFSRIFAFFGRLFGFLNPF
jgi:hypothetical protein